MTENRVPTGVPTGGQFAVSAKAEAAVSLSETPVHDVSTLRPDVVSHVALGPGRAWATLCGLDGCDERVYGDAVGSVASAKTRHRFTEHREDGDEVFLRVDEWVTSEKDGIRVSFTDIGEGVHGDYDETDPTDVALLRLDVQVRPEHPQAEPHDEAEPGWHWVQGETSLCTNVERDNVTPEQMRRLLGGVRADLIAAGAGGSSLSGITKGFESMTTRDAARGESDSPTGTEIAKVIAERAGAEAVDWCDDCDTHTAHHRGHAPYSNALSCMDCDENGPKDDSHLADGPAAAPSYVNEHGLDLAPGQSPRAATQ